MDQVTESEDQVAEQESDTLDFQCKVAHAALAVCASIKTQQDVENANVAVLSAAVSLLTFNANQMEYLIASQAKKGGRK